MPGITIYAALAARIREERKRRDWTLERLAASAGISTGFLAYLEQNRKKPSLATIERIARALGVPIAELFREAPSRGRRDALLANKLASMIRDIPPGRRKMAYRVIRAFSKKSG